MAYKKHIAGITIEIDGDTSKLVKSLDQVSSKVERVGKKIEGVGKDLTRNLTVPIVTAAGVAVGKFAEVDKTMTLTNQTMGNTADEAQLLNKAMEEAASNSVFGMNDAANASLNFARAGLDATEAANALAPAMNLAAGEGGDLDTVSAGLVGTINGFGDSFESAEHYADVFANACNNSALDVNSLSDAMSIAAPIFNAAGYSVEDAALYMGVMANAGIDANTAATSLKTGMARLVKPTEEASIWLDKLGINVTNADGTMKDSVTIQSELHDAFSTLSESEQIAAASAIFGKNQMSNWLALINTAPEDVSSLSSALETEGTTAEMADAMMGGFGGSIEKLKSSVDVLMTSLGGLIAQYLTPVIEKVQGAVDAFMSLDDETKEHIIKIAGIVAAVGPVLIIIGKVVTGIGSIISVASGLIAAISAISAPVLIVIGVITALIAIGVALYKHWDDIKEGCRQLGEVFSKVWGDIKSKVSETWENIKTKTSETWNNVKTKVTDTANSIRDKWNETKTNVTNKVTDIKNSLSDKWNEIKENTRQKFEDIKEKILSPFETVKTKIRDAIDYIKGLFNFEWHLPHISLPHFSIDGEFSLDPPSVPHFSIDWYKKAMNSAYMLNGATIFGASGGHLLGGGEAGSEMIIGTNKLMQMIGQAKGGNTYNNQFVINGVDRDPQELAQEISYYLDMQLQRTSEVFA